MKQSEEDIKYLRDKMVNEQLLGRNIEDKKVIEVFRKVPRHLFVEPSMFQSAYGDFPLSIGNNQTISQPYMVALMLQLIDLRAKDRVLEIGTGSGYQTAILAELSREVFSIERIETLAKKAGHILEELGYGNVTIKVGDGTLGWQEFKPFDKIIVTASSLNVPEPILSQLSRGGKMVIPIGERYTQRLMLLEKTEKHKIVQKDVCGCVFVPLIGKYGWKEDDRAEDF